MKNKFMIFKTVLIIGLIAWGISKFDFRNAAEVLKSANYLLAAASVILGAFAVILVTIRWKLIMRGFWPKKHFSVLRLTYFNLLSGFYTIFFPTIIAGETVRIYKLGKDSEDYAKSMISAAIDRMLGISTWATLFFAFPAPIAKKNLWVLIFIVPAVIYLLRNKIKLFGNQVFDFSRHHPLDLAKAMFFSFLCQFSVILSSLLAFKCFGVEVSFLNTAGITATAAIAGVIPLSVFGVGPREAAYVGMLPVFGATSTQALLVVSFLVFSNYLFGFVGIVWDFAASGMKFSKLKDDKNINPTV